MASNSEGNTAKHVTLQGLGASEEETAKTERIEPSNTTIPERKGPITFAPTQSAADPRGQ